MADDVRLGGYWPGGSPLTTQNGQDVVGAIDTVLPAYADAVGYRTLTFSTASSFTPATVDLANSRASGFQWYRGNFFGIDVSKQIVSLSDGIATVSDPFANLCLSSVAKTGTGTFVGRAFGGGGYFEATARFDPGAVNVANGWPSVWTMAVEHLVEMPGENWPGQSSAYKNFIEVDLFEYNKEAVSDHQTYSSSLHHWYGQYAQNQAFSNFADSQEIRRYQANPPIAMDWTAWNRFGMLWVPATDATRGYIAFYCNGAETYRRYWDKWNAPAPPPSASTGWAFGALDQQHLALLLGSGTLSPLQVRSFNVWQSSDASNLVY